MILQAEATTMTEGNIICWGKVGDGINVGGEDGVVRNLVPGTYQAMLTVNVEDEMDGLLQLMQNDKCVQSIKSYNSSVSTSCIIRVQEGDKITVTFENSLEATSYLTLVRLGN
ncbi:hypothetical protein PHYBOEH_006755 [Phytophthora boehmeriae]|uniref:Uncharacterized protein n=1 Tax=Phytophthora boehmeriae TaxID=109152 RepID=A0A8T1WB56_9STRA|nr:hypothetical protein PHYBOEH_006755 [Phytophthora boehmeriae]